MILVPSFSVSAHNLILTLAWAIPSLRRAGGKVQSVRSNASDCFSRRTWGARDALGLLGGPVSYSQG